MHAHSAPMLPAGEEQAGLVVPPLVQLPPEQYADLLTGSVKCWFEDRGFGFIRPEGGEEDVFVHKKVLKDGQSLIEGSSVMFNLTYDADRRRFQATRCFGATLPPEEAPAMPRKWKLPFCLADPWEELYSLPGAEHLRSHLSTGQLARTTVGSESPDCGGRRVFPSFLAVWTFFSGCFLCCC
ncbi:unnamed protein product [Effrenium voratum]|nr:unnamed protein product [Effrenium voratum]